MTVADVLEQVGWPLGSKGRTLCPLHGGKNQASFSYRDEVWACFSCGEGGGVLTLRKALGLWVERPPLRTVGGINGDVFLRHEKVERGPSFLAAIKAAAASIQGERAMVYEALHRRAIWQLGLAEEVLRHGRRSILRDAYFELAADLAGPAYGWLDEADAALSCPCRETVGGLSVGELRSL